MRTGENFKNLINYCIKIRKQKGLSQEDVGKICGMHKNMISGLETRTYIPKMNTFLKYINALEIKITLSVGEKSN